ncbi:RNase H domain-containing protein [Trichonephila clavipes]|nr:RNase H domain-containing protein [Trichonephila clavipes]
MTSVVKPNLIELKENALKKWQRITRLVQLIWNKWHRCYLSELQQRNKWQFKKQNVKVGDLVVLIEDNMPTFKWPLGRITEIYSGSDALIRVVKHMTATAGSDVVQSGRPIFDDLFQHLWPYIGNNTANVVFQMVKRLWLIRIDQ